MREQKARSGWLWVFAPINSSVGIFLTLLPLYVLDLGGNIIDVGIVTSSYLFSFVPAALFWGYIIDRFPHRKTYIAFSYLGMGIILVIMQILSSFKLLSLFLVLYGFTSAAATPAINLLIMESSSRTSWPDVIAKLSSTSIIGYGIGVLLGFMWVSFFPLGHLITLSALLSLVSGALVLKAVREPQITLERRTVLFDKEVFINRMRGLPILFNIPRLQELRRFRKMMRYTFLKEVPLLYFSVFIFNFAVNMFATSFAPSLSDRGILDNEIFLITFANTIAQAVTFYYIRKKKLFEHHTTASIAKTVLALRTVDFLVIGITVAFWREQVLTLISLVTYSILGVSWAIYNPAVSSLVFRTLDTGRQGEILGIYTAFGGLFSFTGALISGYLTQSLSFLATCIIATILIAISIYLLDLSAKVGDRIRLLHDIMTYG